MSSKVRINTDNGEAEVALPKKAKRDPLADRFRELERLSGQLASEDSIKFEGNQYILPEYDDLAGAIRTLTLKLKDDETMVDISRVFSFRPWDGAYAFLNACKKHFGMVNSKGFKPASFFSEQQGTQWMDIPSGPNGEMTQVPWGEVYAPIVPDYPFYLSGVNDPERGVLFNIGITCPRKYRRRIEGLFMLIQRELDTNSLYRGKAFDGQSMPQFLDLNGIDPDKIVYPRDTYVQLEQNIFSVFTHTERLRENGIPLKRAVLMAGDYGTGKTLAGYLTAKFATANGWTFILCRPQDNLNEVLQTARLYQPAAIHFEDLDVLADPADASGAGHISKMLDAFDGIRAKGTELMVTLTTNHVDKLHKGMVRPGRLDGIIHLGLYDADGIERLIKATIGGKLDQDVEWGAVVAHYMDLQPAFIVEAAQRALRFALLRDAHPTITGQDLIDASRDLRPQLELMAEAPEMSERDRLGGVVDGIVKGAAIDAVAELMVGSGQIHPQHKEAIVNGAKERAN